MSLQGQSFTIDDVLVSSPDARIADIEFDHYHNRICWQSGDDHKLWVCGLDTATWALTVPDGKEVLVDTALVPISETSNGGEWGYDMNGTFITYNKEINKTRYVALAGEYQGSWILNTMTDVPDRMNPHPTQNPADTFAAIKYIRSPNSDHTKYKFLNCPNWEFQVLWYTDAHWAKNERILTGILCNGQVGMVNFETGYFPKEITNEPGTTFSCPYMWRAPEKGNQRMFFARANENEIRVYRETGPITGRFTLYMSFTSPSSNPEYDKIASPEPVIYQGQSYISFMVSSSPYETGYMPSEIWIARLDSLDPMFRMVSDTGISIRTDPEAFATPDSLLVYYTEVLQPHSPEAVYRIRKCRTGVGLGTITSAGDQARDERPLYRAFPNPFTDRISITPVKGDEWFTLTSLSGSTLWTGKSIERQDFSFLPKGIHFLKVSSEYGATTIKVLKH